MPKIIAAPGKEIVIDSKRREKMMTSKKEVAKFKPKGTKLIFDDDGQAHAIYELQDEDKFRADGTAESQRQKFLDEEGKRVKEADVLDRKLAKDKKREKKEKRKRREAEVLAEMESEDDEDAGPHFLPYEAPEPFEASDDDEGGVEVEVEVEERDTKRQRKWFEDDPEEEKEKKRKKSRGKIIEAVDEPETLEDLEMLASGLLG